MVRCRYLREAERGEERFEKPTRGSKDTPLHFGLALLASLPT